MKVKQPGQGVVEFGLVILLIAVMTWAVISLLGPIASDVSQRMIARAPAAAEALDNLIKPSNHAIEQHGEKALTAANCFNNGGTIQAEKINPTTGRKMSACQLFGKWFVRIQEANGDPVTMFPKERLSTLEQIIQYMTNTGYIQ